ncbi:MAG TPA: hypothetical protein VKT31_07290 [Solirubrobacteraceae bacterium]|nr:hypothetical protein [Solirubrobacteraceae bacterium]
MGPHGRPYEDADRHERALLAAMRWTMLASVCLPAALASVGASATGEGVLPVGLAWPLAALAALATSVCLWKVIVLWRTRPRRDDDEHGGGWWRRHGEGPRLPGGGPGGIEFDWRSFERQFWNYVHARAAARQEQRVPTRC